MEEKAFPEWVENLLSLKSPAEPADHFETDAPHLAEFIAKIEPIKKRYKFTKSHAKDTEAISEYISGHPLRTQIYKYLQRELCAKRGTIKRLAHLISKRSLQTKGTGDLVGKDIFGITEPEGFSEKIDFAAKRFFHQQESKAESDQGRRKSAPIKELVEFCVAAIEIGILDLHSIFPEIPENLSFCEFQRIGKSDGLKEYLARMNTDLVKAMAEDPSVKADRPETWPQDLQERRIAILALIEQSSQKWVQLSMRWLSLTGQELEVASIPWTRNITKLKAPVPAKLGWSKELAGREARRMGHRAAGFDDPGVQASRSEEKSAESSEREATETHESRQRAESATSTANADNGEGCTIKEIYEKSGGHLLKQPDEETDLFTFPQKLGFYENIFYDYSMILPIDCIDNPCLNTTESQLEPRDTIAARILVGKIRAILNFLEANNLTALLGRYELPGGPVDVVLEIKQLILEVETLKFNPGPGDPPNSVQVVRELRSKLRKMAGLMRLISRYEMLPLPESEETLLTLASDLLGLLDPQLNPDLRFSKGKQKLPKVVNNHDISSHPESWVLEFPSRKLKRANGKSGAWPNASGHAMGWYYKRMDDDIGGQWDHLTPYLEHVGGKFGDAIKEFQEAGKTLAEKVIIEHQNLAAYANDLQRISGGLINGALASLSELFSEIAEQIPIAEYTVPEGRTRLGLQVVFRQTWFPAGYVMGKLVGYKNIIPSQKDEIHRRTFIKTVAETTTAEEFATSRQDDLSRSQKETAEVVREAAQSFGFSQNASGSFDIGIGSIGSETQINAGLESKSRSAQNLVAEASQKASAKYSENREVKIRHLAEAEDVKEVTSTLENKNSEITANYFYYQLLREYEVHVALHDFRPVLLRTRETPSATEIDDRFLSNYTHILIRKLPPQLSSDAQECADRIEPASRALLRQKSEVEQRAASLQTAKEASFDPADAAAINRYRENVQSYERLLENARQALAEIEDAYLLLRAKMNRVIKHLRENINYYMQFIWQESPHVDSDMILEKEVFCGNWRLPDVTRGLLRQGYRGNEEIFEYTGPSWELFEILLLNLRPGDEILRSLLRLVEDEELATESTEWQKLSHGWIHSEDGEENLWFNEDAVIVGQTPVEGVDFIVDYKQGRIKFKRPLDNSGKKPTVSYFTFSEFAETSMYQYLEREYSALDLDSLISDLRGLCFPEDPSNLGAYTIEGQGGSLTTRTVQIAQDALVVETLPGQVPLLEGWQMVKRMLSVQRDCLENNRLRDGEGEDYGFKRYEGVSPTDVIFKET